MQGMLDELDPTTSDVAFSAAGSLDEQPPLSQSILGGVPYDIGPDAFQFPADASEAPVVVDGAVSGTDDEEACCKREDDDNDDDDAISTGSNRRQYVLPLKRSKKGHRRLTSVAEDLFEATNKLEDMRYRNEWGGISRDDEDGMTSDRPGRDLGLGKVFDVAAKTLINRKKNNVRTGTDDESSQMLETMPAAATARSKDSKKTDDPEDRRRATYKNIHSNKVRRGFKDFGDWFRGKRRAIGRYIKIALFFIMIPATGIAAILYYVGGYVSSCVSFRFMVLIWTYLFLTLLLRISCSNPPCQYQTCGEGIATQSNLVKGILSASASWWLLFIFCRQLVTLSLALVTHAFVVNYVALQTNFFARIVSPFFALFIILSKGWPITVFCWCFYDFVLLYGEHPFAMHWLYWQDAVDLFNSNNPSGNITSTSAYMRLLILGIGVSILFSIKKCWISLAFGKQTYGKCFR